jgi:hypothetical protein
MSTALQITGSLNNSVIETSKLGLDHIEKQVLYNIILFSIHLFGKQSKPLLHSK